MPIRTKIICTIGPSCNTVEMIRALAEAGMDVARLNFSHGSHEEHLAVIHHIKRVRNELQKPLAIMLDTKGPEIRIGNIEGGAAALVPGQRWLLVREPCEGNAERAHVTPPEVLDHLTEGVTILFDDGYISSHVVEAGPEGVVVELQNGGIIRSKKGVNIPNVNVNLPAVTEKDISDIRFGCLHDIDIIAASFVRSPEQVLAIRKLLAEEKKADILVVAKIENSEGVNNFDSIVQIADGVMIARGDLGVEVPLSKVPKLQKMMIRKSYLAGKPAVTATQMLESMIHNPRPTRAEASDVANAIYDSTSAVMLSGETAVGKYPLDAVRMMKSIIAEAEEDFDCRAFFDEHARFVYHDVPSAVTLASVKTAYSSNAKAVFTFTNSGSTARLISRLRPVMPILAMTPREKSYHQMAMNWGVHPVLKDHCSSAIEGFATLSQYAMEKGILENGDLVVLTAGNPFGISGTTNMMMVESIGDVLVRGEIGMGENVHGKVAIVLTPESARPYEVQGSILVLTQCNEQFEPLIKEASGVVMQNHIHDTESELSLVAIHEKYRTPFVFRADGAAHVLKEGQLVTVDPEKGLVYKGVII